MLDDLELDLETCPKITTEHTNLTQLSVMNVHLTAQELSKSVSIDHYLKYLNFT